MFNFFVRNDIRKDSHAVTLHKDVRFMVVDSVEAHQAKPGFRADSSEIELGLSEQGN